jgi:crotonobetainyl-CoA:carnitine CoA-transferase CaiB-like acyl-CoA transferase
MKKLPLEGIRVVDLTVLYSGPFATWLLGSLGAEIIVVDSIHHWPDMRRLFSVWPTEAMLEGRDPRQYPNREFGQRPWNRRAAFNRLSWNKKSCCINLIDPRGKEIFKKLIMVSDVFIENNSANTMDHLELGPDTLLRVNPRLVCINMPGYGRTGPYKDYVGLGENAEALTGHYWVRGYDDEAHPVPNTSMYHMDSTGGVMAALGVIMGLRQRKRTGKGVAVDFAQIESFMPQLGEIYMDYIWNGRVQKTRGNRHPTAVQGCYRCRGNDAWLNITVHNDLEWQGLCRAMGHSSWTQEPQFSSQISRRNNHDAFDERVEEWTKKYDKFEAFMILQKHGVPAGPVLDEAETYHDPHLNARGFFQTIYQEETGNYRYPGFLWKMTGTPMTVRNPPCCMGEHNEYVFKEVIGMSEEEIARLTADKVIGGDRYVWA